MVRVEIDDPDAAHYPFKFQKGDIVALRILGPEANGEIVGGEFEGSLVGGSYSVTYTVRLKDGFCYEAKDSEVKKVDPNSP